MSTFTRPNIISLLEFKEADFFDREGSEHFVVMDPVEALDDMLENCELALCGDAGKYLDTTTVFVSLSAFRRLPVEDFYRKAWPEGLVEHLRESFQEEHGNEDGDDFLSDDDANELHARMKATVDWYLTRVKVYPCESVRTWRFDNEDLRELVQQLRPEWLTPKESP